MDAAVKKDPDGVSRDFTPSKGSFYDRFVVPTVIGFAALCVTVSLVQRIVGTDGETYDSLNRDRGAITR